MSLFGLSPTTLVADSVLARLAPLTVAEGRYVRTLKRAAGNLDRDSQYMDAYDAMLQQLDGNAPAALVAIDEVRDISLSLGAQNRHLRFWLDVNVYLVDNYQGRTLGRLEPADRTFADPAAKPGMDSFSHDVLCLLAGAPTHEGYGKLMPRRGRTVYNTNDRTIYEWQFQVEVATISVPVTIVPVTSVNHVIKVDPEDENVTVIDQDLG